MMCLTFIFFIIRKKVYRRERNRQKSLIALFSVNIDSEDDSTVTVKYIIEAHDNRLPQEKKNI